MFEWTDPDDGTVWEMLYDVPQFGNEREGVDYRVKGTTEWHRLPPFAEPPKEAMEFWHGKIIEPEPVIEPEVQIVFRTSTDELATIQAPAWLAEEGEDLIAILQGDAVSMRYAIPSDFVGATIIGVQDVRE